LGDAPFIMNYFMECVFEGAWEFRHGDAYTPGGAVAVRPPGSAFDGFRESNRVLGRAKQVPGPSLPPTESARTLAPAAGLAVDLLLHEPEIAQPFYFSFDERGRLWVTQSRQYPYPAGLTMLSRDKYYRARTTTRCRRRRRITIAAWIAFRSTPRRRTTASMIRTKFSSTASIWPAPPCAVAAASG